MHADTMRIQLAVARATLKPEGLYCRVWFQWSMVTRRYELYRLPRNPLG